MSLTLRDVASKIFLNAYSWKGSADRDKALTWAKSCVVQPQGTIAVIADALAIPVTASLVLKTVGSDAEALTIVDGTPGQILTIQMAATGGGGGVGTLTVGTNSTGTGWVTAVFTVAGDSLTLMYVDDTAGWIVLSSFGTTTSTAAAVIALA